MHSNTLAVAVTSALLMLASSAAFAEGAELFSAGSGRAPASDPAFQALANDPSTSNLTLVSANAGAVTPDSRELTVNLGPGLRFDVNRLNAYVDDAGVTIWYGQVDLGPKKQWQKAPSGTEEIPEDALSTLMLARNGDSITGTLRVAGQLYTIRPLNDGQHAVVEVNEALAPPDHPKEFDSLPAIDFPKSLGGPEIRAISTIRVLVAYTPAARTASGDITGLISLAVAETNQGYVNSGVEISMVRAVSTQVTYTESGSFSTDLARFRGTTDGYMDSIHSTRNTYTADVAVLLINNSSSCGLASGIGSTASTAFAAAHWSCATGYYSFGHEVGHLQSARHDPTNDPTTSPYVYGHGYQYASGGWRTIMAYACSSGCTRLNYWSNPNKTYGGVAMGTTTKHHNQRVLQNTKAAMAAFR